MFTLVCRCMTEGVTDDEGVYYSPTSGECLCDEGCSNAVFIAGTGNAMEMPTSYCLVRNSRAI